jgi:hypothetical protein
MARAMTMVCIAMTVLFAGCGSGNKDIVVVEKTLRNVANASSAGGMGGVSAPTTSWMYWVEGTAKNQGTEEVTGAEITFIVTDGGGRLAVTADVASIPPGGQVTFKTDQHVSSRTLTLVDADPEIRTKR